MKFSLSRTDIAVLALVAVAALGLFTYQNARAYYPPPIPPQCTCPAGANYGACVATWSSQGCWTTTPIVSSCATSAYPTQAAYMACVGNTMGPAVSIGTPSISASPAYPSYATSFTVSLSFTASATTNSYGGSAGPYTYKWYDGTSASGPIIGTSQTLTKTYANDSGAGSRSATVVVTSSASGQSTTASATVGVSPAMTNSCSSSTCTYARPTNFIRSPGGTATEVQGSIYQNVYGYYGASQGGWAGCPAFCASYAQTFGYSVNCFYSAVGISIPVDNAVGGGASCFASPADGSLVPAPQESTYNYVPAGSSTGGGGGSFYVSQSWRYAYTPPIDLTASMPTLTSGTLTPSTAVTFASMVANSGTVNITDTFSNRFQIDIGNDGTWDTNLDALNSVTGLNAGETKTATSPLWTATEGTHAIRMCADLPPYDNGVIVESNENNNCSVPYVFTVAYPAPAATCSASPSTATTSQSVVWTAVPAGGNGAYTYLWSGTDSLTGSATTTSKIYTTAGTKTGSVTVTSAGQSVVANCSNSVVVSDPLLTASCSVLPTSATTGQNVTWTATVGGGNGTYSYSWWGSDSLAGATQSITKSYATTGVKTGTVQVTSGAQSVTSACSNSVSIGIPPAPNLTAGSVTPATATVNSAVTLSATVTNSGNAATGAGFTNLFQRATDSSGTGATDIGTYVRSSSLSTGSNFTATLSYTFSSAGTWYVRACADKSSAASSGVIAESNEGDNCGGWTLVTVSYPAPSTTCSASPSSATVGQSVTWTAVPSGGDGSYTYSWSGTDSLSGTSASVAKTYATTGTKTGSVTVVSAGQSTGAVSCSNSVAVSGQPDLTAGGVSPGTGVVGTAVTLSSTITNGGATSTGAGFTNLFQRATDSSGTGATDIGTYVRSSSLSTGSNFTATLSYTFSSAGTWYVRACADKSSAASTGTIVESNEGNNCGVWTQVIATQPNLTASAAIPVTATVNVSTVYSSTITNAGNASTGVAFTNRFEFDDDVNHASGVTTTTDGSPALAPAATDVSQVSYTFATTGTKYVRVCADTNAAGAGAVTESNESDNCTAWTTIIVGQADLTAGSVTPITAIENTATTLSATVTNLGTAATGAGFTNLFQIDADADHAAVTATRTDGSPALAPAATDVSQVSYTFPSVGTWYVRACADNNASWVGTIAESNEGNNCGAWTPVLVTDASGCALPAGHEDYCKLPPTGCGPCTAGKGDCDANNECVAGLICPEVSGVDSCTYPACNDGADNDGDGVADYPNDHGCASFLDTDERTLFACDDGVDNDSDGTTDSADVGCHTDFNAGNPVSYDSTDDDETIATPEVSITPNPEVIRYGSTGALTWSAHNVEIGSCALSGGGSSWSALNDAQTDTGSATTPALTNQTTYTLTCRDLDGDPVSVSAVVKVTPKTEEF